MLPQLLNQVHITRIWTDIEQVNGSALAVYLPRIGKAQTKRDSFGDLLTTFAKNLKS